MKKEEISSNDLSYNDLLRQNKRLKKTNYTLMGYVILSILIMLYNMLINN